MTLMKERRLKMSEMAEAIRQLIQEKGYSEDSVRLTIEKALKAAYKSTY